MDEKPRQDPPRFADFETRSRRRYLTSVRVLAYTPRSKLGVTPTLRASSTVGPKPYHGLGSRVALGRDVPIEVAGRNDGSLLSDVRNQ